MSLDRKSLPIQSGVKTGRPALDRAGEVEDVSNCEAFIEVTSFLIRFSLSTCCDFN